MLITEISGSVLTWGVASSCSSLMLTTEMDKNNIFIKTSLQFLLVILDLKKNIAHCYSNLKRCTIYLLTQMFDLIWNEYSHPHPRIIHINSIFTLIFTFPDAADETSTLTFASALWVPLIFASALCLRGCVEYRASYRKTCSSL